MTRTNLCPNPGLSNNDNYPNGDQAFFGDGGVRVTGVAGMPRTAGWSTSGAESTLPRCEVTAGVTYRFSAYVKGNGASHTGAQGNINWYSGGAYQSSSPGTGFSVNDGQVTRCDSGAYTAPPGADQALLNITGLDGGAIVTAILYSPSATLSDYFDGDTASSTWNAVPGNSTSTTTVGDDGTAPPPPGGGGPPPGGGGSGDPDSAGVTQGWGTPFVFDDFTTYTDISQVPLSRYDGPGHVGNGIRSPDRWSLAEGTLLRITGLPGSPNTGGGATEYTGGNRQYGRWEVRMRAYNAGGGGGAQYHPVMIIWPSSEAWPNDGEYDFQEGDVGDTEAGAFIHYPHPNMPVQQEHAVMAGVAMADWHNYAYEWQPSGVAGFIDGRTWYAFSGGAGPGGRSDIQAMPQGSLRLQMDAFSTDGHQGAIMDFDWVRIWDQNSVVTDTPIAPAGIVSGEAVGSVTVGNRFRMYLNNTPAPITTAFATPWDQIAGAVGGQQLGLGRVGANTAVSVAETSTSNQFDVAAGQWISEPMTSGGVLSGGFGYTVARNGSDPAADLISHAVIRVVSGNGMTVRGTAVDLITAVEWGTTLSAGSVSGTISNPVTCLPGDRLVVELGYRATNVVATTFTGTLRYGGTGDLESGDTGGAATTLSPWVAFTDRGVEALFRGQIVGPSSVVPTTAVGTPTLIQPPTQTIEPTAVGTGEAVGSPVVTALAAVIAPLGFTSEALGTPMVGLSVAPTGIGTGEAFGLVRVRRATDLQLDGIGSAEAFGSVVLVHFQELFTSPISSGEAFGLTVVEDPNRSVHPFGIPSGEQVGVPGRMGRECHPVSIDSAEAFGFKRLSVRVARWQLVAPTKVDRYRLGEPRNVIYVRNVRALTVLLNGSVMTTVENPSTEAIRAADQAYLGGHANITDDIATRDLWLANGYGVEQVY